MVKRGYASMNLPPAFGDYKNIKNNTKLLYGTTNTDPPKVIYNDKYNADNFKSSRMNLMKKNFKPVGDFKYSEYGIYDTHK